MSSRTPAPSDRVGAGWYFFDSPAPEPLGSNECQRRLIAIAAIRGEVNNGGFHQFFFNSSGHLGSDALVAVREVEDMTLASILDDALRRFGEQVPLDRDERQTALLRMPDDEFRQLDRAYYDHEEASDLDDLMDRYVWSHAVEFFEK